MNVDTNVTPSPTCFNPHKLITSLTLWTYMVRDCQFSLDCLLLLQLINININQVELTNFIREPMKKDGISYA